MTGAALAEASGLTKGFISQFERGLSNPSLESLRRIAATLNVSLTGLLSEEDGSVLVPSGAAEAPKLFPQSHWNETRRGIVPLTGGPTGQAIVQLPGGAWLTSGRSAEGERAPGLSLFVVHGQALFTQEATEILLGPGDALAWRSTVEWKVENRGSSIATLLVTGDGTGKLQIGEQSRLPGRPTGAIAPAYDARGPLRLVAMRAHRQERKGG